MFIPDEEGNREEEDERRRGASHSQERTGGTRNFGPFVSLSFHFLSPILSSSQEKNAQMGKNLGKN